MENRPDQENASYESYQGYSAQPYGAEEMPQSSYPQPGATPYYTPGEQSYAQQPSYSSPASEQGYNQQQQYYGQQQQQQQYSGQQQQQYYNQQQAGFNAYQGMYGGDVGPAERTRMGLKARTAGMFCYLFGWVGGLVFLVLERENRFVRFHAMQSVLFFGIMSVIQWVASTIYDLDFLKSAIGIVIFIGWLVLFINANKGRYYKLPVLGDLAEQLLSRFS